MASATSFPNPSAARRASFEVPEKRFAHVCFRLREHDDGECHGVRNRCFTSAHGIGRTWPARSWSRRRPSSSRHALDTVSASASSKLSSSAMATADRSSTGSARTSSKSWSTRAFMASSPASARSPHNRSFGTDTQRQGAAIRVCDRTSRGVLPLRVGQLRRYTSWNRRD